MTSCDEVGQKEIVFEAEANNILLLRNRQALLRMSGTQASRARIVVGVLTFHAA
jgi:hypothetical protein